MGPFIRNMNKRIKVFVLMPDAVGRPLRGDRSADCAVELLGKKPKFAAGAAQVDDFSTWAVVRP